MGLMRLILASGSPWRQTLLSWLEIPFSLTVSGVNERAYDVTNPEELVSMLSVAKARAVSDQVLREQLIDEAEGRVLVLGADTVIVVDGEIIGKPVNRRDAWMIMNKLKNKTHSVFTGICLMEPDTGDTQVEVEETKVRFRDFTDKELETYLDTKDWEGKAGAYQILGAVRDFVADIEGSVTNVIGLPLITTAAMLEEANIPVEANLEGLLEQKIGYPS